MKIVTVIGARPQIIKAAAISRAIRNKFSEQIKEVIVHTGQHYDENMSEVFFNELQIPRPDYNLEVGSGNHGAQTAKMLEGMEEIILKEKPDAVVVYGDTNSTVAGGLAASKLHVPLVHIEAGLRSFNKAMPEEVNRIVCDHTSTLLFSPTKKGVENLAREGFKLDNIAPFTIDNPKVYHCGDIMYDNSRYFSEVSDTQSTILRKENISGKFILSTIHRNSNTDDPVKLQSIFEALLDISDRSQMTIVLPLHPRTKKMMEVNLTSYLRSKIEASKYLKIIPPVSFLDVIALEKNADMVITDSGGVQKEAFYFKKPCLILRPETEWVEIVECGNAILCDANKDRIINAFDHFKDNRPTEYPELFGDGKAADFICKEIIKHIG
ncbi:MAG: UDP-N-acetylglucosamine 2-epimerase (non-hydrolyzing) [Crocinitomicaceae bacterium]|nr:UDP-N-acetylglucosamine 2-epimerase (non-hydrolyzing) [Crocinitomicaceae bacterium]